MKNIVHRNPDTNTHLHAYYLCIWVGAIVRYTFYLGRRPYKEFYTSKNKRLNFWTGFITLIFFFVIIITIAVILKK